MIAEFRQDVAFADEANGTRRPVLLRWLVSPSIRCATYMRIAARGGVLGRLARNHLLWAFGCDVAKGAQIRGGVMLPHPTGIVIGMGVVLKGRNWIYQHVTIGANARGDYPVIEQDVKLYPDSMVTGRVTVGTAAIIGAGAMVYDDVAPGEVVRGPRSATRMTET